MQDTDPQPFDDHLPVPVDPGRGHVLSTISTAIVRLHSEFYGKGPTRAKSWLVDDMVICVLRDGFTRIERTLIDRGQESLVAYVRSAFQEAMRDRFVGTVEEATGRKVVAFLSEVHINPDLAVEMFFLEPEPGTDGEPDGEVDGKVDVEPSA
jgi:uncharacterized protein YbcI